MTISKKSRIGHHIFLWSKNILRSDEAEKSILFNLNNELSSLPKNNKKWIIFIPKRRIH